MSTNFKQTRNELILDSLQLIGAYGIGRTVSSEDMNFCVNILNKMVKAWGAKGLRLFTKTEAVLYVTPSQPKYLLGNTLTKAANVDDEVIANTASNVAAGETILSLTVTLGMQTGDQIGIVLTDKTIHWAQVTNIAGLDVTLSVAVPLNVPEGSLVYTYTDTLEKPLRVLDCRRRRDNVDLPLVSVGYQDYQQFPVKTPGSSPTQFAYNPKNLLGELYLWPAPSDANERIMITYERVVEDLNYISDDFDFPAEWLEPLTWQLAVRLARPFGKAAALNDILPLAESMYKNLLDFDAEVSTIQMSPDIGEYA